MVENTAPNPKDKWIPRYFVIFFAVIALLDGIFVYMAVSTQTGEVTENPYQVGLAYDELLTKAKAQPQIENTVTFEDGALRWTLPIDATDVKVRATFVRPVQEGYDFSIDLEPVGKDIYEARPELPLRGNWTAKLIATWDNNEFQTRHDFIAR